MQLPEHERQAHRDAFRSMALAQKAEYILAYYKLPLVLALIVTVAIGSVLHYRLTHKEALLYVGMANVQVAEEAEQALTMGFLDSMGRDPHKEEVCLYRELYLVDPEDSTDHQYSYASRLKLLASIDAEQFDVVLMSKQSYDLLSHSGYLMDLTSAATKMSDGQGARLVSNDVIIEDNELELELGEVEEYEAVTEVVTNAFDVSDLAPFQNLSDNVYLGIIGNTPRLETTLDFIAYLCSL